MAVLIVSDTSSVEILGVTRFEEPPFAAEIRRLAAKECPALEMKNQTLSLTFEGRLLQRHDKIQGGSAESPLLITAVIKPLTHSAVLWGTFSEPSSELSARLAEGIVSVSATGHAFAAVNVDGSVVCWSTSDEPEEVGEADTRAVQHQLASGVSSVSSNQSAFVAIKDDGTVVAWGEAENGGNGKTVSVDRETDVVTIKHELTDVEALVGIKAVYSTWFAFAAVDEHGKVFTWGDADRGGDCSYVQGDLSSGVAHIVGNNGAFAALKASGQVIAWGDQEGGGDIQNVKDQLASNVVSICSTGNAFAALKSNGAVVTWGDAESGGAQAVFLEESEWDEDAQECKKTELPAIPKDVELSEGVVALAGSDNVFAAIKDDGSLVTWGCGADGADQADVADQLKSGVCAVYATKAALAALKDDGSLVTWGVDDMGGDSSRFSSELSNGVASASTYRFMNSHHMVALKANGAVFSWGQWGRMQEAWEKHVDQLSDGIVKVTMNEDGCCGLKEDW